jgi:hypothetical protein
MQAPDGVVRRSVMLGKMQGKVAAWTGVGAPIAILVSLASSTGAPRPAFGPAPLPGVDGPDAALLALASKATTPILRAFMLHLPKVRLASP